MTAAPRQDTPRITDGLVNAHTHMYGALAALGLPAPVPEPRCFVEILQRVWWRLDRALDERTLRASARLYAAEALLHGTTTLVDHHESPALIEGSLDVLADACQELGLRAFLCYGATERNGGRPEARRGLAECARFVHQNRRPLVRGLVGLHASFTVGNDTVRDAAELCRELGTVMHVHVAEDDADLDDALCRGWGGPLERLLSAGALPPGSVLAHGVHLSPVEVRGADTCRLWLVHNPRSNEANRVGWAGTLVESDRVALGTDGFVSDMFAEDAALARLSARNGTPPRVAMLRLSRGRDLACELWDLTPGPTGVPATVLPGTACGPADDSVEWPPEVSTAGTHLATRVIVAERTVVDEGKLVFGDYEEIRAHAAEALPAVRARMEALA